MIGYLVPVVAVVCLHPCKVDDPVVIFQSSTLSIVQPDDGHYRRTKHVVASFSHLCYKYIYVVFWLPCVPYWTNIKYSRKFLCPYEFKDNLKLSEKHPSSFLMHRSVLVPLDFYEIKYWIVFCVHSNSFQLKASIIISFIQKCCLSYWIFMKSNFGIHSSYTVIQFNLTSPLLFQMNRNVDVSLHFYEIKYRYPSILCTCDNSV